MFPGGLKTVISPYFHSASIALECKAASSMIIRGIDFDMLEEGAQLCKN